MMADIEAVLFDLGGTLVDYPLPSWPVTAGRCLEGVYAFLVRPDEERPPPAADLPGPDEARVRRQRAARDTAAAHRAMVAVRRMVRSLSGSTLPHMAEACARPLFVEGRLYDDALPAIRALKDRGYRLGLVSNTPWGTPEYLWESQLDRFDLTDHFEVRLFSSAIGYRKPDPRIFRAALARLGVPAERALFIGDRPRTDVAGASRVGMRTALVVRPGGPRRRSLARADLSIGSLAELLDHLPAAAKKR
jgi:putative hydrolase of the HAD superfamily